MRRLYWGVAARYVCSCLIWLDMSVLACWRTRPALHDEVSFLLNVNRNRREHDLCFYGNRRERAVCRHLRITFILNGYVPVLPHMSASTSHP